MEELREKRQIVPNTGTSTREHDDDDMKIEFMITRELDEDMIIEILSRLPAGESLMGFKIISKHWKYILTTQAFLLSHSRTSPNPRPKLYLFTDVCHKRYYDRDPLAYSAVFSSELPRIGDLKRHNDGDMVNIRGHQIPSPTLLNGNYVVSNTCNGLVCLYTHEPLGVRRLPACLFSLRTHSLLPLYATNIPPPPPSSVRVSRLTYYLCWCFMGYDPTRNEYKVLRIIRLKGQSEPSRCEIEILTLGSTESWKVLDDEQVPCRIRQGFPRGMKSNSCCIDGVIYWVHQCTMMANIISIAAFDTRNNEFRTFDVDQSSYTTPMFLICYLASLKDCPTLLVREPSGCVSKLNLEGHKSSNPRWTTTDDKNRNFGILQGFVNGIAVDTYNNLYSGTLFRCSDVENDATWSIQPDYKGISRNTKYSIIGAAFDVQT